MPALGLIGYPLGHSFSQRYFSEKFEREAIMGYSYANFPIPAIQELPGLLASQPDLLGFNVTIPYKRDILGYLHHVSPAVQAIGACNCVKISNGELTGYNTDVIGFEQSLRPYLKAYHTSALILGTGGAALAVQYVFDQLGITYQHVSRTSKNGSLAYEQLDRSIIESHLLIVNTTPLGMYPDVTAKPPIPYEFLGGQHHLFDLIYNPPMTAFLQEGLDRGASIQHGEEMLHIQAEESWRIWTSA